jgi:predicted amidophosphoribosyltransferase
VARGKWFAAAGDLFLGAVCPGCERPWWGLCATCRATVALRPCSLTQPDPPPVGFPLTATSSPYDPVMKRLISAHKEQQALSLTPFLAQRLGAALGCLLASQRPVRPEATLLLVPVPSSARAVRARGFDATWAMTRGAGRLWSARRSVRCQRLLSLARRVEDQAGLSASERKQNLADGFRAVRNATGSVGPVVIIDDVVTTGTSLTEAAAALRRGGFVVLGAATVAATVRSRSRTRTDPGEC